MKDTFTAMVVLKWNAGRSYMEIWRDHFLTCTLGWFRKWLKVARLDTNEVEILTDLLEYLEFNISRFTGDLDRAKTLSLCKKKADIIRERLEAIT